VLEDQTRYLIAYIYCNISCVAVSFNTSNLHLQCVLTNLVMIPSTTCQSAPKGRRQNTLGFVTYKNRQTSKEYTKAIINRDKSLLRVDNNKSYYNVLHFVGCIERESIVSIIEPRNDMNEFPDIAKVAPVTARVGGVKIQHSNFWI
jgi:hypothetical protein